MQSQRTETTLCGVVERRRGGEEGQERRAGAAGGRLAENESTSSRRNMTSLNVNRAPRRLLLVDVLKEFGRSNAAGCAGGTAKEDRPPLRLMGTVAEILEEESPTPPGDGRSVVYFVIDDGTATMGVLSERDQPIVHHVGPAASTPCTLESFLSEPRPPIQVGQTVDCIGCIRRNSDQLWLAASSVSIVRDQQEQWFRQIQISSECGFQESKIRNSRNAYHHFGLGRNGREEHLPRNRVVVGGELEYRLNEFYHNRHGNIIFKVEDVLQYVRCSKKDGGISPQEVAILVGALDPRERRALDEAIDQLRNECRVYLNQGKLFPL